MMELVTSMIAIKINTQWISEVRHSSSRKITGEFLPSVSCMELTAAVWKHIHINSVLEEELIGPG